MKNVRTLALSVPLALSLCLGSLASLAIGCGGSVEQPQTQASAVTKAPIAPQTHGVVKVFGDALGEVALRPDQRTELEKLAASAEQRHLAMADGKKDLMLTVADQIEKGSIDRAALQPKIDRIVASNKMTVTFDWEGDRLKSITPVFDSDVTARERKIVFGYDDRNAGIAWAGAGKDPRGAATADADELFRRSMVRLANNPYADPVAIQSLTGKNVTLGIAGNHFFDPFVWDDVHYFQFTYDDRGRVSQARELADAKGALTDRWVDFEWDGQRLLAVRAYQGADAAHRTPVYQRTLQYQDNRLLSEEVQFQGKSTKIRYNYNGNRLVSAAADRDPSLDDRSRQVTFR